MNKHIVLTSFGLMAAAATNANADNQCSSLNQSQCSSSSECTWYAPTNTCMYNGTVDGTYTENTLYANAATLENLGNVDDGATVYADPEYTENSYNVDPGKYISGINDDGTAVSGICPVGSYCPGGTVNYSEIASTRIECSSLPGGYTSTESTGATYAEQCFRPCTTSDIEHSVGVGGNVYYGGGADCRPTSCENGYHEKSGIYVVDSLYQQAGITEEDLFVGGISSNGTFSVTGIAGINAGYTAADFGISAPGEWANKLANGMVRGNSVCSSTSTSGPLDMNINIDITSPGINCWCNINSYTPNDGATYGLTSAWLGIETGNMYQSCEDHCAIWCGEMWIRGGYSRLSPSVRQLDRSAACAANTINIDWGDASTDAINATNAGVTTFGGDIRTPQTAPQKRGFTFRHWIFKKNK